MAGKPAGPVNELVGADSTAGVPVVGAAAEGTPGMSMGAV